MHLPAEIINKVLHQLINVSQSEFHPFDREDYISRRVLWSDLICTNQHEGQRLHLDQSIFSLRLVSREWNKAATAIIAKCFTWKIDLDSEASLQRASICFSKDVDADLDRALLLPTREIVRKLMINPGDEANRIFTADSSAMNHVESCLLKLLGCLKHLETFILSFSLGNSNTLDTTNRVVNTLTHCFLQTEAINSIVDLQLKVPSTYHAGQFLKSIVGDNSTQVRHLLVEVIDSSGKVGSRDYLQDSYYEDSDIDGTAEDSDGDSDDNDVCWERRSTVQKSYPNRQYQQVLWEFISSCTSLETLGIKGTHFLDLNRLNWQPSVNFPGLRVLHLSRVYANIPSIQHLLQPSDKNSTPRLQKIVIDDVKVPENGGIWGELATFLLKECSNLELISLYNLTYFLACGRAAGLSSPEDGTIVDSSDDNDLEPLTELVSTYAYKRGYLSPCPFWLREMGESLDIEGL